MDNSLKIGEYLLEVLNDNEELQELLGEGKIFPLIAKEGTLYPLVIYTRDSVLPQYTKQPGGWTNQVTISYRVYSTDYDECVAIANTIRNELEYKDIEFEDIKISDIRLVNVYESFIEDAFVETITFNMWTE